MREVFFFSSSAIKFKSSLLSRSCVSEAFRGEGGGMRGKREEEERGLKPGTT